MKSRKRIRLVRWFFLAVMVLCLIPVGREFYLSMKHQQQRDALREKVEQSEIQETDGGQETDDIQASDGTEPEDGADGMQTSDGTGPESGVDGRQTADGADGAEPENDADGSEPDHGTGGAGSEVGTDGNSEGSGVDEADTDGNDGEQQAASHPAMLRKYAALKRENEHLAGWLLIEGTGIDYPVMQCEDDEYYLHHDFYGEDSRYGCLYVRERADLDDGVNFVIYGHNMRDGAMFGNLDYYLKESFYKEHPFIYFDTLYEERIYEIVAVFRSQVYQADDDVFKYYQFYEADTIEEFEEFYTNIKALSIYDTGVEAEFGDTFLTCSTCAYHVQDGRFVVVAKRVE